MRLGAGVVSLGCFSWPYFRAVTLRFSLLFKAVSLGFGTWQYGGSTAGGGLMVRLWYGLTLRTGTREEQERGKKGGRKGQGTGVEGGCGDG